MILFLSFFLLIIILILLNIKISIVKLKISNINSISHFQIDIIAKLGLYIGKKIKIFEIYFNKERLLKNKYILKFKKKNDFKKDISIIKDEKMKNAMKKIRINLENVKLKLNLGTEDAKLTAMLLGIISAIFGILIPFIYYYKNIKLLNNLEYQVTPNFSNKNILKLEFTSELSIRVIHIIYILYVSLKINKKFKDQNYNNNYKSVHSL